MHIFQWILQNSKCYKGSQNGSKPFDWRAGEAVLAWFCIDEAFKIMLRNEGGKHFSKKMKKFCKKKMCKALKAQGKEQIAHEIQKIASVMHRVVFADGAWRRKVHGSRGTGGF